MVLTPRPDGTPRRTVDLQPLNRFSTMETHHIIPLSSRTISPRTDSNRRLERLSLHRDPARGPAQNHFPDGTRPIPVKTRADGVPLVTVRLHGAIRRHHRRKTKRVDDTVMWDDSRQPGRPLVARHGLPGVGGEQWHHPQPCQVPVRFAGRGLRRIPGHNIRGETTRQVHRRHQVLPETLQCL